jgi:hypothetical protein
MSQPSKHPTGRSIAVGCFLAGALLAAAPRAAVGAMEPSVAKVTLANLGNYEYTDPQATSGNVATANGVVTIGTASFASGTDATVTSVLTRGVYVRSSLDDYLIFHVPGGGSSTVSVTIAGTWYGTYDFSVNADFKVGFALGLGPNLYQGYAYANPFYDDGIPASDAFTANRAPGSAVGTYSFTKNWTVFDGQQTEFFSSVYAECSNGGTAFINDPLTISLPAGITFTSSSGSTYAIPEPATMLLAGLGLVGMTLRHRRRTSRG